MARVSRRDAIVAFLTMRPSATVREIGAAVGLRSTSSVQTALGDLERAGTIERTRCGCCVGRIWKVVP